MAPSDFSRLKIKDLACLPALILALENPSIPVMDFLGLFFYLLVIKSYGWEFHVAEESVG